jgi:hypothetical protein
MVGYFYNGPKKTFTLHICPGPCQGVDFQNAKVIAVSGKREARAICKARKIQPWNF